METFNPAVFFRRAPRRRSPDAAAFVYDRLTDTAQRASLDAMAQQLHLSTRTLKRRLGEQGLSYRRMRDEARHRASLGLLCEPGATMESVAQQLGYSSGANFARAFRRWAGVQPGAWRTAQRASPGMELQAQL